ncbi:MAG: replication initiator protein A [Verrucomicrobiia bacterium]
MERIEEESMPQKNSDGRDELNLAEFPLCALAHRLRPEQKTLRFEDRVWDERRGETITRQLTITGSDAYGLPTALDDEVLLGLIQLSRLSQFAERTVRFTRYQLIQLLGWRNESKSYERIEASLNRWTGVTLYYQRAWWNKAKQCWVDEKFHVLDNVRLFQRESDGAVADDDSGNSAFVWNEVIFRSFQAGNLKSIDFDFFRELESAIARRLYRFLDKRFFRRDRWEFDLKEFACEHAGLSRTYDSANLKRKLRGGITELEQRGYLRALSDDQRFLKVRSGEWRVVFEKTKGELSKQGPHSSEPADALVVALIARGVAPSTARSTVKQHPATRIQPQLEVFDYLVAQKDPKVSRNPPGFLLSAIRGEYAPPKEFLDHATQERRRQETEERRAREARRKEQQQAAAQAKEEARERAIEQFWQSQPSRLFPQDTA